LIRHGTAIRIGVNHGSLSDRIMSRYGDTPEGMVASCMEFLRICREENFPDVVISIKANSGAMCLTNIQERDEPLTDLLDLGGIFLIRIFKMAEC